MKKIILILGFLISSFTFAQHSVVSGTVKDMESVDEPLIFARVTIKETGIETLTDENGQFKFENLKSGEYTLVFSFVGYETLEKSITVKQDKNFIESVSLSASTLGIDELMSSLAIADQTNDLPNNSVSSN